MEAYLVRFRYRTRTRLSEWSTMVEATDLQDALGKARRALGLHSKAVIRIDTIEVNGAVELCRPSR